jgi:hypothetical protein
MEVHFVSRQMNWKRSTKQKQLTDPNRLFPGCGTLPRADLPEPPLTARQKEEQVQAFFAAKRAKKSEERAERIRIAKWWYNLTPTQRAQHSRKKQRQDRERDRIRRLYRCTGPKETWDQYIARTRKPPTKK